MATKRTSAMTSAIQKIFDLHDPDDWRTRYDLRIDGLSVRPVWLYTPVEETLERYAPGRWREDRVDTGTCDLIYDAAAEVTGGDDAEIEMHVQACDPVFRGEVFDTIRA